MIKTWGAGAVDVIIEAGVIVMLPLYSPEFVIVTVCAASATSAAVRVWPARLVDSVATATGLPASDDSEPKSSVPDIPSAVLDVAVGEFPVAVAPETRGRLLAPGITAGCVTSPA